MLRLLLAFLPLVALWLLMSGLFKPLLIGFGLFSAILSVWIMHRMEKVDGEEFHFSLSPIRLIPYTLWLLKEIAKSAINVTRIVLQSNPTFNQRLFSIPITQHSDMGQVIYANSITLTPGTITVETEPGHFLIHTLDFDVSLYDDLNDMDRRVTSLEFDQEPSKRGGKT